MTDPWARLFGETPGSIDETVIKALDAVREYKGLLRGLEHDAIHDDWGWSDESIDKLRESVALCDRLLEELDGWKLNPDLRPEQLPYLRRRRRSWNGGL